MPLYPLPSEEAPSEEVPSEGSNQKNSPGLEPWKSNGWEIEYLNNANILRERPLTVCYEKHLFSAPLLTFRETQALRGLPFWEMTPWELKVLSTTASNTNPRGKSLDDLCFLADIKHVGTITILSRILIPHGDATLRSLKPGFIQSLLIIGGILSANSTYLPTRRYKIDNNQTLESYLSPTEEIILAIEKGFPGANINSKPFLYWLLILDLQASESSREAAEFDKQSKKTT